MQTRVLIIDDDDAAVWLAQQFLGDAGFDARGVTTVAQFDSILGEWAPDVVIADVDMPSLTGPELCRILKDRYQTAHIPVVLYSARPEDELAGLADDCEAETWLNKAAGLDELVRRVKTVCEQTLW